MSNVCECREEIELRDGQLTLMELYMEMNRLKLENIQLRKDNNVLHNKLNVGSYDKTLFEGNNPDNGYDEEELANAYAIADTNKKFV